MQAEPSPAQQQVPRTIITASSATSVEELFLEGQTSLRQGRPADAVVAFDLVVRHDPTGAFSERALFQGALAREANGDLGGAAARFEELARRFAGGRSSEEALVRAMRVRLHLESWQAAAELGAVFLERHPRALPAGSILAHAARGFGMLAVGRLDEAEHFIGKGLRIVDELMLDRAGRIPRDLAQLYFALGEARRLRAEAATLSGDVTTFLARLERRCELLLAAQSAYSDAMRAYDAHWSAMAGYRVGELYQRLHQELMAVPPPATASQRDQALFEGAMRLRYSVLLTKAAAMMEHTLALAARTGEDSEWIRRAEASGAELAEAVKAEQRALDRLPFTRQDLEAALRDLEQRAAALPTRPVSPRRSGAGAP